MPGSGRDCVRGRPALGRGSELLGLRQRRSSAHALIYRHRPAGGDGRTRVSANPQARTRACPVSTRPIASLGAEACAAPRARLVALEISPFSSPEEKRPWLTPEPHTATLNSAHSPGNGRRPGSKGERKVSSPHGTSR
ncbi:hypothetical protein AOLI_G00152890 [Acnodon oligacanthus]